VKVVLLFDLVVEVLSSNSCHLLRDIFSFRSNVRAQNLNGQGDAYCLEMAVSSASSKPWPMLVSHFIWAEESLLSQIFADIHCVSQVTFFSDDSGGFREVHHPLAPLPDAWRLCLWSNRFDIEPVLASAMCQCP